MSQSVPSAPTRSAEPFEIKSAALNLIAFLPRSAAIDDIDAALERKLAGQPDFFVGEAGVIDLSDWPTDATALDLTTLVRLLRQRGLDIVGVRGGDDTTRESAHRAGLTLLPAARPARAQTAEPTRPSAPSVPPATSTTMIIDKPVRSGQQVYARGGDLIVLALVSHGAEVIADGNIHVYAPLRGRALAGARGRAEARIFTQCMEAELLSIAGVYRSLEEPFPASIQGRPAQVRLDGSKLLIEALAP